MISVYGKSNRHQFMLGGFNDFGVNTTGGSYNQMERSVGGTSSYNGQISLLFPVKIVAIEVMFTLSVASGGPFIYAVFVNNVNTNITTQLSTTTPTHSVGTGSYLASAGDRVDVRFSGTNAITTSSGFGSSSRGVEAYIYFESV